jgi:hypothetical protein
MWKNIHSSSCVSNPFPLYSFDFCSKKISNKALCITPLLRYLLLLLNLNCFLFLSFTIFFTVCSLYLFAVFRFVNMAFSVFIPVFVWSSSLSLYSLSLFSFYSLSLPLPLFLYLPSSLLLYLLPLFHLRLLLNFLSLSLSIFISLLYEAF